LPVFVVGETGFVTGGYTSGFAQCKNHLAPRAKPNTVKQKIPPGSHPKSKAPLADASLNASPGASGIDCQSRYPIVDAMTTAAQNVRTPVLNRTPDQEDLGMHPARTDGTAATTHPRKKIARKVSSYGVMSSSTWKLMRAKVCVCAMN